MDEGADYTLLIYSMYDVLPAEEEDWISDPWMAKIHPFRDYGDCISGGAPLIPRDRRPHFSGR